MRCFQLVTAVVVSILCEWAVAEKLPPSIRVTEPRIPLTIMQVMENDAIYAKLSPKVYKDGAKRVTLQPPGGKRVIRLPASRLSFEATGYTQLRIGQQIGDGGIIAVKESIEVTIGRAQLSLSIDPHVGEHEFGFLYTKVFFSPWFRYVTPEAVDRLNARCRTELEQADALYSLRRTNALNPPGPLNAENMAWLLCGTLQTAGMGDGDNLTRYEIGDLVFYSNVARAKYDQPDRVLLRAHLFSKQSGR